MELCLTRFQTGRCLTRLTPVPVCACAAQTLCCGNTVADQLLQVTGGDVRLVDASTRALVQAWQPPPGLQINVASCSPSQARSVAVHDAGPTLPD